MTFYLNKLLVLNISRKGYGSIVEDVDYRNETRGRLRKYFESNLNKNGTPDFVTNASGCGFNNEYDNCINHMEAQGLEIIGEEKVLFLGYQGQEVIFKYSN